MFWKPNGQTQLLATLNPDFGQVESDDLVVNFDATEVFISEKRPFFTENQALFDFTTPSDFSQLLYTRRVGGPADDGSGAGDIIGALKFSGSLGATKYGVFAAEEDESVGRRFTALRLVRDFATQNLGLLVTNVDRPFLDRKATVLGVDHNWRPTARWNVRTRLIGSDIEQSGETSTDTGATVWADYEMDHGWRQQWILMHFGNDFQINDAGFLDRNNMNYAHWQFARRFTALPARIALRVQGLARARQHHSQQSRRAAQPSTPDQPRQQAAQRQHRVRTGQHQQRRHGRPAHARQRRGQAAAELQQPTSSTSARASATGVTASKAEAFSGGLSGNDRVGYRLEVEPRYFVSDALNIYVGLEVERTPDWLVWQQDTLFGSFDGRQTNLNAGFNWNHDESPRAAPEAAGDRPDRGPAPGVSRRSRRQLDSHRRAGRRFQRPQPRPADPLPLRARAPLISIRGVRARRLRPDPVRPTSRTGWSATASTCATTSSC